MVTQTFVGIRKAGVEKETTSPMPVVTYAPVPLRRHGLLLRMARHIVSIYEGLGGPPTSDRDRVDRDCVEAQRDRYFDASFVASSRDCS